MDIKKLAVILDAVRLGSFNKAAERHGYTSSALIYIADGIENELGVKLIERDSSGIRPTKEGELLLPRLAELCGLAEDIKREAHSFSKRKSTITIGCYSSVAKSFLASRLAELRRQLSDIEVAVVIKDSIREMAELGADIFLVSRGECSDREYIPLYTADYVAVVNSERFEGEGSVTAKELCRAPFILPRESAVINAFSQLPTEIISVNADDDSAIIEMVKNGIGNTVLTSRAVSKNDTGIRVLPLSPEMKSEIVLTYDRETRNVKRAVNVILKSSV